MSGSERSETGRLIVLCGLPGSGKSTLAHRMVLERGAVRLSPDDWMTALDIDVWSGSSRVRIESLQWDLTQQMLRAGVTVVIEWGVWARAERDLVRERARDLGAAVELHYLDVPVDELWRRVRRRDREDPAIERADLELWATQIEVPDRDELQLFDPSPPSTP